MKKIVEKYLKTIWIQEDIQRLQKGGIKYYIIYTQNYRKLRGSTAPRAN